MLLLLETTRYLKLHLNYRYKYSPINMKHLKKFQLQNFTIRVDQSVLVLVCLFSVLVFLLLGSLYRCAHPELLQVILVL